MADPCATAVIRTYIINIVNEFHASMSNFMFPDYPGSGKQVYFSAVLVVSMAFDKGINDNDMMDYLSN